VTRTLRTPALGLAGLLALGVLAAPPARGQDDGEEAEAGAEEEASEEPTAEEAEDDAGDERWLAVTGGEVHTGTGAVRRGATVLAEGGRIVAIGRDVAVPEEAEVLDVSGMRVYPGLVAFDSRGIVGDPPQDATDPFGLGMVLALSAGITTVGADGHVAKLTHGTLEGHLVRSGAYVELDVGDPKTRRALRRGLERIRTYLRKRERFALAKARGEEVEEPNRKWIKGRLAQYERLLTRQARALFEAEDARTLTLIADLAQDFGFGAVVRGGAEAWTVAGRLGRAGVAVVVTPRGRRRRDDRLNRESGWTIENAARLWERGVDVAVMSQSSGVGTWGLAGRDLFTLPLEAAFAVRGGLPEEAALEAITLAPARALGVAHRVGSLEVGKDCDLIVTRGDLLHYETLVEWAVVDGRIAYDKAKESLLRHVRPRDREAEGNREVPQLWPRPKGLEMPEMPEEERQ